jgi:hypothetical protein
MKLMKSLAFSFLAFFILSGTSCKKDNKCDAGSGGSLTLITQLKHHGSVIINDSLRPDTVWIKYNAKDWSGAPSGANAMFIGEYPEDHVHISGLKCGDYYLFASGWDASSSEIVKGGRAYSTEDNSGELHVDIAVTE